MQYHHVGVPTKTKSSPDEGYHSKFKYYSWGYEKSPFHIQWHRFDADAPFHPLILSTAHVAFRVKSMEPYLSKYPVIMDPIFPVKNFQSAMIAVDQTPIELIITELTEDTIAQEHMKNMNRSGSAKGNLTPFTYHYFAIPSGKTNPRFRFSDLRSDLNPFGTQIFDPNPELPPILQTLPHLCFLVPNLKEALHGKKIILEPFERQKGQMMAVIEEVELPIALIEQENI